MQPQLGLPFIRLNFCSFHSLESVSFTSLFCLLLFNMLVKFFTVLLLSAAQTSFAALTETNLQKSVDALPLDFSFNPVKASYWTGYPHHRRTPFAVSPDGKSAYLAYLDSSETDVHVQRLDPTTFTPTGTTVTIAGAKEGLLRHLRYLTIC